MTKGELTTLLSSIPEETEIVMESRIKTGYDEGEVYHSEISTKWLATVGADTGKVVLLSDKTRLAGGW